jgi:hypothetical protein
MNNVKALTVLFEGLLCLAVMVIAAVDLVVDFASFETITTLLLIAVVCAIDNHAIRTGG